MKSEEPVKRKAGRPKSSEAAANLRQALIDAAAATLQEQGAEQMTIRNVCERAGVSIGTYYHYFKNKDDLLQQFVREIDYRAIILNCPYDDLAGRICELFCRLLDLYQHLGLDFTRSFYNSDNLAISVCKHDMGSRFEEGTLMDHCQLELERAQQAGCLRQDADPHTISGDLCYVVAGCILEWCLSKGELPLNDTVQRIIRCYLTPLTLNQNAKGLVIHKKQEDRA